MVIFNRFLDCCGIRYFNGMNERFFCVVYSVVQRRWWNSLYFVKKNVSSYKKSTLTMNNTSRDAAA